jgi:hypothetical protein
MDAKYGPCTWEGLCPQWQPDYLHLHHMNQLAEDPVEHTAHTQYNVKQGLKLFGQKGWMPYLRRCSNCMIKMYWAHGTKQIKLTKEDKKLALL